MRNVPALILVALATPLAAVPLPSGVGLTASDPVGESRDGEPILAALDVKTVSVDESGESGILLAIETAGSLADPETGPFKEQLSYRFSLDIDNDGFTGTEWGADFSAVLKYDIAARKWSCDFERHSETYSRRMRIVPKVAAAEGNRISVEIESALFLTVKGGVWGMETRGDGRAADVIAPDRAKPCRIVKGDAPAYDAPERQGVFFDNVAEGGSLSRPFVVPDRFAAIASRLHIRKFRGDKGSRPEVRFFFGAKEEKGKPFFSVEGKGSGVVARIGLSGSEKVKELAVGEETPAFGRDLKLRLERKGSWLAYFVDDKLVGSLNAKGLITNANLLTMRVSGADLRSDQFAFTVEEDKDKDNDKEEEE